MKIIITGALGHIGSKLIRSLEVPNEEVEFILIDNLRTQRFCSLFNLPKDHANYKFFDLDLISSDLDQIFSEASHVIHLAALTDAAGSFDNAAEVESVNLTSTQKVVDLCIKHGLKLINISSTSVYGTQKNIVDESCTDEELNPQSPYARTKLLEEQLIQQHCQSGLLKGVILRFGTIFGTSPGIRFHTAVNKFCFQAATKVPITVWKTAYEQQRPYLDIDDAINSFEFVITNNIFDGEIYNIVSINATVKQILHIIEQIIPDLKIEFVENEIMNQLSYTVLADKIEKKGFNFHGSLDKQIANTLNLFSAINY